MPVTATFHTSTSPPSLAGRRFRARPIDPVEEERAAKANELLNLRSKNISSIIAQREKAGNDAHASIKLPPKNPRMDQLHKELGIDKVVIVKCPFEIDTTPGGFYKNKSREAMEMRPMYPKITGTQEEFSANGAAVPAVVDGRLLRGGWTVQ
jgi:hypothetical protein